MDLENSHPLQANLMEDSISSATPADSNTEAESRGDTTSRRIPLVTTRIGFVFLVVGACILLCAFAAHALPDQPHLNSLMWIAAVAVSSFAGMVSMRSVRTLRTIEMELRRRRPGMRHWQTARPILGSDPITDGWNELIEDATCTQQGHTQAHRAPATLDQEVITLARAMRGMPVAWVITDTDGLIRFVGPAACGILGIDESGGHIGADLTDLLGLRDPHDESAGEALDQLLGSIRMVTQRRALQVGSRQLFLRITRSRLAGRSGDGEGMAWVLTDETQQRLTTEARDQFVMTATHELRTPLTNLQAYAEALQEQDGIDFEQQKEFCNIITSEANRLGRLVDQLLTVSQMEAGSMTANRHELEMLPMVEYATDQMRSQAEQKRMKLTSKLSAKLPTVFGDRDKLQAALVNLIGNAVKYTPEGGEVLVSCTAEDRWIRIEVQDNGPGIPEEEHEKVFEKFYRGDATRDSEQRGNGLGLAFSREIARLHGGDIDVDSTVGQGSSFTLRLPVGGQSRSGI